VVWVAEDVRVAGVLREDIHVVWVSGGTVVCKEIANCR